MPGIFISYRREDSGGYAGRLFDILSARFGREHTYMDIDTIKGGDNFPAVIEDKVRQCNVLLALIGERWLTLTGEDGTTRRLDTAGDFVRLEIVKALERDVRVIPVLVGGATMPHEADLPKDLQPLAVHQAMDLRDAHFHADADLLIDLLNRTVPGLGDGSWADTRRFTPIIAAIVLAAAVLAGGVVLYRQTRPTPQAATPVPVAVTRAPAVAEIANVAGTWKASVKYDWGDTSPETFDLEVTGQEISGTVSFLGYPRGIFDGKIEGNRVSLMTKTLTALGDKTSEDKHYYKGTVNGDTIQFTLLTDSTVESHAPVRFTATRSAAK